MNVLTDIRITDSHRNRDAFIYIRQSSPHQVKQNYESRMLQLSLKQKAISFGWLDPIIIDDDLGISAAGYALRHGFQHMLTQVTMKHVGIIFCLDASRLSRNSKDWAQLFELCAFFDTLIADFDQFYNLNLPNDRLLLGIKGTMSEMELSILKIRLREGAIQKAKRGELKFILPPGFIYDHFDKIVFDPDIRIQSAIKLLFAQFNAHSSIRQLLQWYKNENVTFPVRRVGCNNPIVWEIPKYGTLKRLLQNPFYAGVYGYGKRKTLSDFKDGALIKKRTDYLPFNEWKVFIKNNHEAYVTWDDFLGIQNKIAQNKPQWKKIDSLGAIKEGIALLVGLIRCGHCGNKLYVTYKNNPVSASYFCKGKNRESAKRCLTFGSVDVDKCFTNEILKALDPFTVQAGINAIELIESENYAKLLMLQQEVENAKFYAERAFEQFDMADPKNRLVTSTLEDRLNSRLIDFNHAKEKLSDFNQYSKVLTDDDKKLILSLSNHFQFVWNHKKADPVLKKRLIRLFIKEIIVHFDKDDSLLNFVIHWNGGTHTRLAVKKRRMAHPKKTNISLIEMITKLAARIDDAEIARVLNMNDLKSTHGHPWNKDKVNNFRKTHRIKLQIENKENIFTAEMTKKYLNVSRNALNKLVKKGLLSTNQVIQFAPWEVKKEQLDSKEIQDALKNLQKTGFLFPKNHSNKQLSLPLNLKHQDKKSV